MTIASGGHPAPIIRRQDGRVDHLHEVAGTLLGAFAHIQVNEVEFPLRLGEVLVCYTDGLTDAASDTRKERFGVDRLDEAIRAALEPTAASVIASINSALDEFAHGQSKDDIAVVAISPAP